MENHIDSAPIEAARIEQIAWRAQALPRPNGSGLMVAGGLAIIVGVLLLAFGALAPTFSDPGYTGYGDYISGKAPTLNPWKWPALWCGSGLCSLGILLWSLGQIVRAMFFLPARDVLRGELEPRDALTNLLVPPSGK